MPDGSQPPQYAPDPTTATASSDNANLLPDPTAAQPGDWTPLYQAAGRRYGVNPALLRSVREVESGNNQYAVSSTGAQGPMQFEPSTAKAEGVKDPFNSDDAVFGAAKLLRENFDRYRDPRAALMAYNAGTDRQRWQAGYADAVMSRFQRYAPQMGQGVDLNQQPGTQLSQQPSSGKAGNEGSKGELPPGFVLDGPKGQLPPGFTLDRTGASAPSAIKHVAEEQQAGAMPVQSQFRADINAANQGLIGGIGAAVKGAGEFADNAQTSALKQRLEAMAAIDRGERVSPMRAPGYADMTPEERQAEVQRVTGEYLAARDAGPNAVTRAGQTITNYGTREFPVAPQNEGIQTKVAGALGGLPPTIAAIGIGGLVGGPFGAAAAGGAVVGGTFIAAQAYDSTYNEALSKGLPRADADAAATKDAAIQGGLMATPIGRLFDNVPAPVKDGFVKTMANLGRHGVEFASFNSLSTFAHNYIARETYDPDAAAVAGRCRGCRRGLPSRRRRAGRPGRDAVDGREAPFRAVRSVEQ